MITMNEWMELVKYKVTEGSDWYHDRITGLYSITAWDGNQDGWSANLVFSNPQEVYMVEVCDYKNKRAYRRQLEGFDHNKAAWDDTDFTDLESDDDFIQKAIAIIEGTEYDTRVTVPLTMPDDELLQLMVMAHERDMTLNKFVEHVLEQKIQQLKEEQDD
jgi:hypothetical protein